MGVPKFYGLWLSRVNFPGLFLRDLRTINGLFIDLNSLIHQACQKIYGYGEFEGTVGEGQLRIMGEEKLLDSICDSLWKNIKNLEHDVQPSDMLFLAVDGIAPQAKIAQQRSRRLGSSGGRRGFFDSNVISPGTNFMRRVDQFLQEKVRGKDFSSKQCYYSSHLVPGEGEHKIMQYLRQHPEGRNVLHGLDTDLIFLAMLSPCKDLYLWRDISRRERVIISAHALRVGIEQLVGNSTNFVLLCMLLGNDFLPTQPSMRDFRISIDYICEVWRNTGQLKLLDENYNILWENLQLLLSNFREDALLQAESRKNFKLPSPALQYATEGGDFDYQRYRNYWYSRAGTTETQDILNSAIYYCDVWQWVIKYYTRSLQEINRCLYYPYYFPPLITDVAWSIMTARQQGYTFNRWIPQEIPRPLHPHEALLSMLPPELASRELPPELASLGFPGGALEQFFPREVHSEYEGVNDEYLAVKYIPHVDPATWTQFFDSNPQLTCNIDISQWYGKDLLVKKF